MRISRLSDIFSHEEIVCRPYSPDDRERIVRIVNHAFAYQDEVKGSPRTDTEQIDKYAAKYDLYVFTHEDLIIGCVYTTQKDVALHFGLLVLTDDYQGTGLGGKIIESITKLALQQGCESVELDYLSVAPWLGDYYKKYGFLETGEREEWRGMYMIQIRKALT